MCKGVRAGACNILYCEISVLSLNNIVEKIYI